MRDRKQFRKLFILVKVVQACGAFSEAQAKKVDSTSRRLSSQYAAVSVNVDVEAVETRRKRLAANKDLRDVFEMFWVTLNPYCNQGILSKEGYIKCNKQVFIQL